MRENLDYPEINRTLFRNILLLPEVQKKTLVARNLPGGQREGEGE